MTDRAPAYLIAGDDELLLARALEGLLADLVRAVPELEIERFEVGELAQLPELRTASLFGGARCVVLRGAEALSGTLATEVVEYLRAPEQDATLVLVARGTGRIAAVSKAIKDRGERIDVEAPKPWDEGGWQRLVRDELRRAGREAEAPAVAAILAHAGTDTAAVASKVAQLAAATPPGTRIDAGRVDEIIIGHGNRGGFPIADAIVARDPAAALVALRGALEAGEAPLALLGAVTFKLRQLLAVRGGATAAEIGVTPRQIGFLQRAAKGFKPGELAWCHDRLAQADVDLKSSDLPEDIVVELAVIELATSREVGAPWVTT